MIAYATRFGRGQIQLTALSPADRSSNRESGEPGEAEAVSE
jgi:hypothetical protein